MVFFPKHYGWCFFCIPNREVSFSNKKNEILKWFNNSQNWTFLSRGFGWEEKWKKHFIRNLSSSHPSKSISIDLFLCSFHLISIRRYFIEILFIALHPPQSSTRCFYNFFIKIFVFEGRKIVQIENRPSYRWNTLVYSR